MPVSVSPFIMALLMGAAPRYCGKREACKLKVPFTGIFQMISGSMRKATTIAKSARKDLSVSIKDGSFNFKGCKTGIPCCIAAVFTAEKFI